MDLGLRTWLTALEKYEAYRTLDVLCKIIFNVRCLDVIRGAFSKFFVNLMVKLNAWTC